MAEGEGFEPPEPFPVQWFSRPPPSTTRPSLRTVILFGKRAIRDPSGLRAATIGRVLSVSTSQPAFFSTITLPLSAVVPRGSPADRHRLEDRPEPRCWNRSAPFRCLRTRQAQSGRISNRCFGGTNFISARPRSSELRIQAPRRIPTACVLTCSAVVGRFQRPQSQGPTIVRPPSDSRRRIRLV
jgi:hypothetical protein